jgi:hypothetical protein
MINLLYLTATAVHSYSLPHVDGDQNAIKAIMSIIFGFIGAIALLVIVVSGFRYIISAGDPQKASQAKNGIIFALVGLIIAISADAIVAFVVKGL